MGGQTPSRPATPPPKFVKCWRNMPWDDRDRLEQELAGYSTEKSSVPVPNIVLFGLVGSGKSSFFNTIDSIFKNKISAKSEAGSASQSVTKHFRTYQPGGKRNLKFRLCDTMGMEEDQGLDVIDMHYILDGNIPDNFTFKPDQRITPDDPGFNRNPTVADRMHCICYIADAQKASLRSSETVQKIKKLKELASARNIRFIILLTKIDELCSEVKKDVSKAYKSYSLDQVVKEVSAVSGTPISFIYLVKNYCYEQDLEPNVDVLALRALKQILGYVDDVLEDVADD